MERSYLNGFSFFKKSAIMTLIVSLFLVGLGVFYFFVIFPRAPFSSHQKPEINITYELTTGTSVRKLIKTLKTENIITPLQARLFLTWVQAKRATKQIQAGEYAISSNMTPRQLLAKLIKGEVIQHTLVLREGATFAELIALLHAQPAVTKTLQGKTAPEIMMLLDEPTLPPEGMFFPDTYSFVAHTTDLALLRRARLMMQNRLEKAWQKRDQRIIIKTPYEALILASIIEKEASDQAERFIISGVFQRRLAKNMPLQADPTVVYGLKDNFAGSLTKAQLKLDTPYNTYYHKGLPPTPIALPGLQAITAALHPDQGEALYFVAKGDGTHQFSATLKEHNEAVAKYRKRGISDHG